MKRCEAASQTRRHMVKFSITAKIRYGRQRREVDDKACVVIRSQSQEPEPEPEARARSHELEQKRGETKAGSAVSRERQEVETMELKSSESEAGEDEMDPRRSAASSQNPAYV